MTALLKLDLRKLTSFQRQPGSSLLGLAFDGGRLEVVEVRRTNGAAEVRRSCSVSLSLDLLTGDPQLVGRELRKHLDAAGIRERRCAVCIPLSWVLTLGTKLPDLPEPDLAGVLQIEAERGFPYSADALVLAQSRYRSPAGEPYATLVAVPRDHVQRLEAALKAAQLRPLSFSLGIAALQPPDLDESDGVLALASGESSVSLQVSSGGGVAVLRTLEEAFELEGGQHQLQADPVAREVRITLGQLPPDLRERVRRLRIFGRDDNVEELTEQLGPRLAPLGIQVEQVRLYASNELGVRLPADLPVSPALSVAVRRLAGRPSALEFLPPRVSPWRQLTARYSSRKLVWAGATAGAVALVLALAFLVQQWQLVRWRSKWAHMKTQVNELESVQQQIKRFRPWFDESCPSLSILRRLTEAFPEDGSVTAKTVEMREAALVTCSGTARDQQALLRALEQLRAAREVSAIKVEQMRGRSPMQFTFNFHWGERGAP